jgi:anthranilate phosphoribosyltransferase
VELKRDLNVADADGLYAAILEAHSGLSPEDSVALNARLVLLLANQVDDLGIVQQAIAKARQSLQRRP